jgi:formylglycine-generating enzyme required for sulfatase activity
VENADLTRVSDSNDGNVARVQKHLARVLSAGTLPAPERVGAGRILAKLGDLRPGVGLRDDGLPDILWCEVPAGPFLMGSADEDPWAYADEKPQHTYAIAAPYAISRYPITNAQFSAFVEAGGYHRERYWSERGWAWRGCEEIVGPSEFGGPWNLPNHPRVGVSWYEAMAFCRWLTDHLRERGDLAEDQEITLPTEPQWEKAARGKDGRRFAWGPDPDPNRANYSDLGVDTTSAVGAFPGGISPYGLADANGNVWEWTCSLWGKDWDDPEFVYPYNPEDKRENLSVSDEIPRILRGGAFYNEPRFIRCAHRLRDIPLIRMKSYGFRVVIVSLS